MIDPRISSCELASLLATIESALSRVNTAIPVRVVSSENSGGVSPIGVVEIKPLVNLLDSNGIQVPHETISNVPYFRIQGGENAIIIDPQVGDIGIAIFCDKDISSVKQNGRMAIQDSNPAMADSNPGSYRIHDMSDAIYACSIISKVPSQYIRFHSGGIEVKTPMNVEVLAAQVTVTASGSATVHAGSATINAATTTCTGSLSVSGNITSGGNISATGNVSSGGNISATGNIADQGGAKTLASVRSAFNSHVHNDPQGGATSTPTSSM